MTLRVLLLIDSIYGDGAGGTERQFFALCDSCLAMGIDVHIAVLDHTLDISRFSWRRHPLVLSGIQSPVSAVGSLIGLRKYVRAENIGILHTFYDAASKLGTLLKLLEPQLRVITSLRNMGHHHSAIGRLIMSLAFRRSDAVVVNAEAIRLLLVEKYRVHASKVIVVPNIMSVRPPGPTAALDPDLEPIFRSTQPVIVCVANLRVVKGIDVLVCAATKFLSDNDAVLVIVGEGPLRGQLETDIVARGLHSRVHLVGRRTEVLPVVLRATIAVLPSRSEGLSNALIEYALAGKAIVATDVGGNREILCDGDCGVLVPPDDADSLATAISALLGDWRRRKQLGDAAKLHVLAKYTDQAAMSALLPVYSGSGSEESSQ